METQLFLQTLGSISEEGLGTSLASLSSENPYATIRDLPSLPGGPRESSYVEMKGPPSASPPRQSVQRQNSQCCWQPQPQRDSGTYEQPNPLTLGECSLFEGEGPEQERNREKHRERIKRWSDLGSNQVTLGKSHCPSEPVSSSVGFSALRG